MNVALTFDDGPSPSTVPILDLLAEHGAHATFFIVGAAVEGREHVLRRMLDDGHTICNHTLTHPRLTRLSPAEVRYELVAADQKIREATSVPTEFWRAPYLDTNEAVEVIASALGFTHVGAQVLPPDWRMSAPSIAADVAHAWDGAVVCLHDGAPPFTGSSGVGREATVKAVELILRRMDARFVSVAEMFACV